MNMKRFAVIAPAPIRGSGGVARIYNFSHALSSAGYECDVYVFDSGSKSKQHIKNEAQDYYGAIGFNVVCGVNIEGSYDYIMATRWDTAKYARDAQATHKLYLVQDFEACFNPVGDGTILAENSYLYGLQAITYGRWLATKLNREYGNTPYYLDFSSDLESFHVETPYTDRLSSPPSICFIYQHDKPRRCPILGIEALGIVKSLRPDVEIHLVGSEENPPLWFDYKNAGILDLAGLNKLYNKCHVGLCLSSSNPSCNPFDMMAAGLPSVELYRENNLYDIPEEGVLLAHQTPESIAEAIIHLLSNAESRQKMSVFGSEYMKKRAAREEVKAFLSIIEGLSSQSIERRISESELPPRYSGTAVVAEACRTHAVETHVSSQFNSFQDRQNVARRLTDGGKIHSYGLVNELSHSEIRVPTKLRAKTILKKVIRRLGI